MKKVGTYLCKNGLCLKTAQKWRQLYQWCEEDLGDAILKGNTDTVNLKERELLGMTKLLAVISVSVVVRQSDFLSTRQDLTENTRSFAVRLKGKASTCSYTCTCPKDGCNQVIDFTNIVLKDVMVTGLADEDIRKEVYLHLYLLINKTNKSNKEKQLFCIEEKKNSELTKYKF